VQPNQETEGRIKIMKNEKETVKNENDTTGNLFYGVNEYAARLKMSRRNLQRLMRQGVVPYVRFGHRSVRIPAEKADECVLRLTVGGGLARDASGESQTLGAARVARFLSKDKNII
jgi:excisionase family DNA binding protein